MVRRKKYEKPKCICGQYLVVREEQVLTVRYGIRKDGRKTVRKIGYDGFEYLNMEDLYCPSCQNEYTFYLDEYDRIIRDDLKFTHKWDDWAKWDNCVKNEGCL